MTKYLHSCQEKKPLVFEKFSWQIFIPAQFNVNLYLRFFTINWKISYLLNYFNYFCVYENQIKGDPQKKYYYEIPMM